MKPDHPQLDPLGFDLAYTAYVDDSSPPPDAGIRRFLTSARVRNRGPWLHVRVEPRSGAAWLGAFELDQLRGPGSLSGLYGLPSAEHLLIVAAGEGYVVPVRDPAAWHPPPVHPVRGVRRVIGAPFVALWDYQDLALYGPEGPQWSLASVVTDELELTRAEGNTIEGRGWLGWLPAGTQVPFRVEASSGQVIEGAHGDWPQLKTGEDMWLRAPELNERRPPRRPHN